MSDLPCYCASQQLFKHCCQPFIEGWLQPKTCEQLMRSRYSAYASVNTDYILQSTSEQSRNECDPQAIKEWAESAKWVKLEILNTSECQVEFKAYYIINNKLEALHETSDFTKEHNKWVYVDGETHVQTHNIGRNDLCPCDSGKKFKKCCYK